MIGVFIMKLNTIKFCLSGEAACFRKPDVNEKVYFTYNNIHRVALLGILGAILGLKGYRSDSIFAAGKKDFPEFYEMLAPLQIAVIPNAECGYFNKKIQYFNNSVGYASEEEGGNLQVFEQWLEKPAWTIYLAQGKADTGLWEKLRRYLLNYQCIYIPYLGKNDFPAVISNVEDCQVEQVKAEDVFIHSLFPGKLEQIDDSETLEDQSAYIFSEYAPVALQKTHNFYIFNRMFYTNCLVSSIEKDLFQDQDHLIYFY